MKCLPTFIIYDLSFLLNLSMVIDSHLMVLQKPVHGATMFLISLLLYFFQGAWSFDILSVSLRIYSDVFYLLIRYQQHAQNPQSLEGTKKLQWTTIQEKISLAPVQEGNNSRMIQTRVIRVIRMWFRKNQSKKTRPSWSLRKTKNSKFHMITILKAKMRWSYNLNHQIVHCF